VPVQLLESGPAAGALAAAFFGSVRAGGRLLAFDMGGTTAKLAWSKTASRIPPTASRRAAQKRFMEGSGLPINISTIELIEIGAGGGSIAEIDRARAAQGRPAQRRLPARPRLLRTRAEPNRR
jgi:N-methylhydantoinase A